MRWRRFCKGGMLWRIWSREGISGEGSAGVPKKRAIPEDKVSNTLLSNVCRSNNFKDFINHANTLIKNFVTVNYKTIKNAYFNSWITKDIVNEIKTKKALFKRYKIYKNTNLGPVLKNLLNNHNICFNLIRKAKFNYYHKLFVNNYNNPKKRGKL